eukprot:TCONS_00001773-protein
MAEPPAKKARAAESESCDNLLDGFETVKILMNDVKAKKVHVLGKFKDSDENAIVSLSKTPFTEDSVKSILSKETNLKKEFNNDIYGQFIAETSPSLNTLATNTIHPATEKHIMKYTSQDIHLVNETAEDYQNITLPYLEKQQFSINWVYNILDHEKEADRILYEDPDKENGFIILPDLKWDGKQIEDLYLTGICHARGIKSIRDLNSSHLPMLKNMLSKGMEVIKKTYNVPSNQIRAYFHYFPSYYHLHVHFVHLKNDVGGIYVGKAHLVSDVIDNIERFGDDFYAKKTLPVTLREKDTLLKLLLEVKEEKPSS